MVPLSMYNGRFLLSFFIQNLAYDVLGSWYVQLYTTIIYNVHGNIDVHWKDHGLKYNQYMILFDMIDWCIDPLSNELHRMCVVFECTWIPAWITFWASKFVSITINININKAKL